MPNDQFTHGRVLILNEPGAIPPHTEGLLRQEGYPNICNGCPHEATQRIAEFQPDLVILDLEQLHPYGLTFLSQLHTLLASCSFLPVLVLSADADPEAKLRALDCGANEYLAKPVDGPEFLARTKNLLKTRMQVLRHQQLLTIHRPECNQLLASGIATDLNNRLAPILLAVDLLQLNRGIPESLLSTLRACARQGTELVRGMMRLARNSDDGVTPLHLRHLLGVVIHEARQPVPHSPGLGAHIPEELWPLPGNATDLYLLFRDLFDLACTPAPESGELMVSCRNTLTRTNTESVIDIQTPHVEVCVQASYAVEGWESLGETVTRCGGSMRIVGEQGEGTRIEVLLPALPTPVQPPEAQTPNPWPTGHGELILVVESDADLRRLVAMMLEATGYRVITSRLGPDALAAYEKYRERIAAVLTDMSLPLMDGANLLSALREIDSRVRIVTTGNEEAGATAATAYLRKPYSAEQLLTTVRSVLVPP